MLRVVDHDVAPGVHPDTTEHGQYAYHGRGGGCLVTGDGDGIKHVAMNVRYSLQHLRHTVPPQADAGWTGEAAERASTTPTPSTADTPRAAGWPGRARAAILAP